MTLDELTTKARKRIEIRRQIRNEPDRIADLLEGLLKEIESLQVKLHYHIEQNEGLTVSLEEAYDTIETLKNSRMLWKLACDSYKDRLRWVSTNIDQVANEWGSFLTFKEYCTAIDVSIKKDRENGYFI